jgi:hypothetical protein
MISDTIASVTRSSSDRSISSSKCELTDIMESQSKTLLKILNAKVDAAEARAHALEAEHTQYRDWVRAL